MDKEVTWTHGLSDFTFNLPHSVLVSNGLSNDALCLMLTDYMLVNLLYKLRGSPRGVPSHLQLSNDIFSFLLFQLWKAKEMSKTNIEVASEIHRGVRIVFSLAT